MNNKKIVTNYQNNFGNFYTIYVICNVNTKISIHTSTSYIFIQPKKPNMKIKNFMGLLNVIKELIGTNDPNKAFSSLISSIFKDGIYQEETKDKKNPKKVYFVIENKYGKPFQNPDGVETVTVSTYLSKYSVKDGNYELLDKSDLVQELSEALSSMLGEGLVMQMVGRVLGEFIPKELPAMEAARLKEEILNNPAALVSPYLNQLPIIIHNASREIGGLLYFKIHRAKDPNNDKKTILKCELWINKADGHTLLDYLDANDLMNEIIHLPQKITRYAQQFNAPIGEISQENEESQEENKESEIKNEESEIQKNDSTNEEAQSENVKSESKNVISESKQIAEKKK